MNLNLGDNLVFGVWPFGKVKALLQPQGTLSSPVNTPSNLYYSFATVTWPVSRESSSLVIQVTGIGVARTAWLCETILKRSSVHILVSCL